MRAFFEIDCFIRRFEVVYCESSRTMLDLSALEPPTLHSLPSSVEPHLYAAPSFQLPAVADVSPRIAVLRNRLPPLKALMYVPSEIRCLTGVSMTVGRLGVILVSRLNPKCMSLLKPLVLAPSRPTRTHQLGVTMSFFKFRVLDVQRASLGWVYEVEELHEVVV